MIIVRGVEYGTAAEVAGELGPDVTPAMVRRWADRDGLPPLRVGRSVFYPFARAAEIERDKHDSPYGRPRLDSTLLVA